MRKYGFLIVLIALIFAASPAPAKMEKLVLAGPKSTVTHPMAYMVEAGLLDGWADEVELRVWDNPDQLRALIAGGQADFSAVPSHVAANFYNRGVPLRLLNISVWGVLWIVSSDPDVRSLSDLKGEEILLTYRGDLPDLVLTSLATGQGLDPVRDFKLRYLPNFPAAAQQVLGGRARHAILAEPMASAALLKSANLNGKAPKLYRAIDIQKEWGRVHHTKPRMAEAGICALPRISGQPEVVAAFQEAYRTAIDWCRTHPQEAARIVARRISGLKPGPVASALKNARLEFVPAREAKPELVQFYTILMSLNSAKIGGRLPDDGFYGKTP
ncbi:PhnD/SsuA/transferrin family substrate-binding protein [uncultured Desulfosarcina sp.]|uniref:ABC transporter substrate-binding protein n=1 Tax=uncultured Desulfosarcina sp. TaxID=218289 RepID=UPI0029C834E9|nr:PhnD/SsuA/transferrin family substrate-binding protein [uncultured Desulfosarcina sp.]